MLADASLELIVGWVSKDAECRETRNLNDRSGNMSKEICVRSFVSRDTQACNCLLTLGMQVAGSIGPALVIYTTSMYTRQRKKRLD